MAKLDNEGNWLWATSAGNNIPANHGYVADVGNGICVDSNGNSFITGQFETTMEYDNIAISSFGNLDIFIAKLSSEYIDSSDDALLDVLEFSRLYNAYPNPFKMGETALIKADIIDRDSGTLSIYNLKGQCVASHVLKSGTQQISLDSKGLASGIYFYQLKTNTVNTVKKMVLVK